MYFFIWGLGFFAYRAQKKITLSAGYFWLFLAAALLVNHFVVYKGLGRIEYLCDLSLGLVVAALFVPAVPPLGMIRFHKFMADFSYSLYAFHMPILFFSYFVMMDGRISVPWFSSGAVVMCLVLSWVVSVLAEKKRFLMRGWLMKYAIHQSGKLEPKS